MLCREGVRSNENKSVYERNSIRLCVSFIFIIYYTVHMVIIYNGYSLFTHIEKITCTEQIIKIDLVYNINNNIRISIWQYI